MLYAIKLQRYWDKKNMWQLFSYFTCKEAFKYFIRIINF